MYVYVRVYTHACIHIYICICVCLMTIMKKNGSKTKFVLDVCFSNPIYEDDEDHHKKMAFSVAMM